MHCRHSFRALALAALALAGLVGLAPTPVTIIDNFNNNSVNGNLWNVREFGGKNVAEVNQRLQFSANGNTGALSFGALEIEPWGANWRRDFEVEFRYKLNLANVPPGRSVFLGAAFGLEGEWPASSTGIALGMLRDDSGLFLGWIKYVNGVQVDFDGVPIAQTSGAVNIEWDKSSDRLTIRRGGVSVHYDGLYAEYGAAMGTEPLIIAIGCVTADGDISFPGSRVTIDDFEFHGVRRNR